MAVVSGKTGEILATVPIGKGCDATAYDSGLQLAFSSNGEGILTIISADTYSAMQTLATQPTARTMALDNANHRIYTVAAEIEASGATGAKPRLPFEYAGCMLMAYMQSADGCMPQSACFAATYSALP